MSYLTFNIDSSSLQGQQSHNLEVEFPTDLRLDPNRDYAIALHNASLYYSWNNISTSQKNNKIYYVGPAPDRVVKVITIDDGTYSIGALNIVIFDQLSANGDTYIDDNLVEQSPIKFISIPATVKLTLSLDHDYQVDFRFPNDGLLYNMLGFEKQLYSVTSTGINRVMIANGINTILIHCNLVTNSFMNSRLSDIIYSFTPSVPAGFQISLEPHNLVWFTISNKSIASIKMYITDQSGNLLDLNNESVTYCLAIKRLSDKD